MRNDLMTKAVAERLRRCPLGSQQDKDEKEVLVRYFSPYGLAQWGVVEAERKEDGDYQFFGYITSCNGASETWGFFYLSQIARSYIDIHGIHLPMERDTMNYGYTITNNGCRILR